MDNQWEDDYNDDFLHHYDPACEYVKWAEVAAKIPGFGTVLGTRADFVFRKWFGVPVSICEKIWSKLKSDCRLFSKPAMKPIHVFGHYFL